MDDLFEGINVEERDLVQLLVKLNIVSQAQITSALEFQCRLPRSQYRTLDELLVEMEYIEEDHLQQAKDLLHFENPSHQPEKEPAPPPVAAMEAPLLQFPAAAKTELVTKPEWETLFDDGPAQGAPSQSATDALAELFGENPASQALSSESLDALFESPPQNHGTNALTPEGLEALFENAPRPQASFQAQAPQPSAPIVPPAVPAPLTPPAAPEHLIARPEQPATQPEAFPAPIQPVQHQSLQHQNVQPQPMQGGARPAGAFAAGAFAQRNQKQGSWQAAGPQAVSPPAPPAAPVPLPYTLDPTAPPLPRPQLGEILLKNHDVEEWQLTHALCIQRDAPGTTPKLGTLLVKLGYADPKAVERALNSQVKKPG